MSTSQRMNLATANLALPHTAMAQGPGLDEQISDLVRLSTEANSALMRGDAGRYFELTPVAEDFLLMSPFGGVPSRGGEYTPERIEAIGRYFREGTFAMELVQAYVSPEMVVMAIIERANVEVGGLRAQDWALRVTLVYRRQGADWHLVHRHADPLANGVTLEQAAALATGQPAISQ